ncbi:MAG: DNA-3-methyladenine glycosylase [Planctomycetaceae bacterium]
MPARRATPAAGRALLGADFFRRPADRVARDLLGATLAVRGAGGGVARHRLTEVEAYLGAHDLACHGRIGPTRRNATMFGPAGRWYVYLCYGLHWMLNIVTGEEGEPAAVLSRGAGGLSGPGRLTRGLGIDGGYDGREAVDDAGLWLETPAEAEPRWPLPPAWVRRTPRIGVDYAGEWAAAPLRFVVDPRRLPTMDGVAEAPRAPRIPRRRSPR